MLWLLIEKMTKVKFIKKLMQHIASDVTEQNNVYGLDIVLGIKLAPHNSVLPHWSTFCYIIGWLSLNIDTVNQGNCCLSIKLI